MAGPKLVTRKPTGAVPWPFVLIEGPEKSGKSWSLAELSTSDRVGTVYWLDLGEGSADEYGAIPGADYEVLVHDGTWWSIVGQVDAVSEVAAQAVKTGEPPVVLAIDSMTAAWDLLKNYADEMARDRLRRKGKKVTDEVSISMDQWNLIGNRHAALITKLHQFPGIVVVTARGKEVAALDDNGRPIEGQKVYKVEGQKNLAFDASVWVRYSRETPPRIIGARSVHYGVRPGVDEPKPTSASFNLDRLVFDVLHCDPTSAHVRDVAPLSGGELAEHERTDAPAQTATSSKAPGNGPAAAKPPAPSAAERSARAWDLATKLLDEADQKKAEWRANRAGELDLTDVDVAGVVTDDDRAAMASTLEQAGPVPLADLCTAVLTYRQKHGCGPRDPHGGADEQGATTDQEPAAASS